MAHHMHEEMRRREEEDTIRIETERRSMRDHLLLLRR
jgi:hypothetical protein